MANKQLSKRFSLASDELGTRTVASIEGEVGAGKTFFGFTGPEPILNQNIDRGTEGVVEQFRKEGKEIYDEVYDWNPAEKDMDDDEEIEDKDLQEMAIETRDKWEKDFYYALKNGARTIVWDTESRIWQCFRYAEFGAPNDTPKNYDQLNQRFEAMITAVKKTPGVNLFCVRSLKDQWGLFGKKANGAKSFGKSGRREAWGYEHLPSMMFMELTFRHLAEDDDLLDQFEENYGVRSRYAISIGKCRHNIDYQFTTIPRVKFPELGEMLVEGTSQEDWE